MKHKFFSLMVTACAALFSFAGLTGCGGGGGGGGDAASVFGIVTMNDFVEKNKSFVISIAPNRTLRIVPIGAPDTQVVVNQYTPGDPKSGGVAAMTCEIYAGTYGPYTATVVYRVDWPAGADFPSAGAVDTTTYAHIHGTTLSISGIQASGNLGLNPLVEALGRDPAANQLTSDIGIALDYAAHKCTLNFTLNMLTEAGTFQQFTGQTGSGSLFAQK